MSGESYRVKNTLIKLSIKAKKKQQNKELWRNRKTEGRKTMKLGMTEKQKDIRTMKLGITERQKDRIRNYGLRTIIPPKALLKE
jgi:hypothetical protein